MAFFSTCDICDEFKDNSNVSVRVLPGVFRSFGGVDSFFGPIETVCCYEDNSYVKAAVQSPSAGKVLVVDGAGSLRRSLLGGNLAADATRNGWAGIVIDGAVRDVAELKACAIGIFALGSVPMPTERKGQGLSGVPILLQGQWIYSGDWIYADADGMVIASEPLVAHPKRPE